MNTHTVKPVRHGDEIELEISALAFGGDAVGRYKEFAIFVSGALPGERIRVRINQVKDHYASADLLSLLRRSADRVSPPCPIFEECGGCQWQHLGYPKQLQTKRQFVVDALSRIGRLPNLDVQPCLPSPQPYAYRNKAMPVLSIRDGHFISGIYEPRSHHLIPYQTCAIQGDPINGLIQKALQKIDRSGLTPYQEKKHSGFLRHLAVRQGVKTGELLLAFVTRAEVPEERLQKPSLLPEEMNEILPRVARELMEETPGLVGVLQNINPSRTNIVFGPTTRLLAGRDHYFEIIDDLKLKVSLKSFLQVNTQQADILHAVVREALGDPGHKKKWGTILDLYSGIGTLAMAVSDKADYVVGVEEIGAAVEDARANAEANRKNNIDFLEGDVDKILVGLKDKGLAQIDAAVLDPPRKGVLPEILARITALHPQRLVYVSCDPSTLARDLGLLTKHGFTVDWVQPLDMFPQTYHVETVVRLTRETPLSPEVLLQNQNAALEPFRLSKDAPPPSLNVSANLEALREKTGALTRALGQWAREFAGFNRSILLSWTLRVRKVFGMIFSGFHFALRAVLRAFIWGTSGFGIISNWVRNMEFGTRLKSVFRKKTSEDISALVADDEIQELSVVLSTKTPSRPFETPTFPSQEGSELLGSPVLEEEIPEEPIRPEGIPVETPSGQADSRPGPKPAEKRDRPWPLFRVPRLDFAQRWEWAKSRKALRWAWVAIFLAGGGFVAKATLSPLVRKSSILIPAVSQTIPDLIAILPNRNFLRYEMVPFELQVNSKDMIYFPKMKAVVEVYRGGQPVSMVGGRARLYLKKDSTNGKFEGNWPIPYNPVPGTYMAEVTVSGPQWSEPKTFESAFTVSALKPRGLFPGYAALTMEGGKQLVNGAVPALDGSGSMKAANALDWAKFMGANMFCYLMGQTSIWDHITEKDFPFNQGDYETGHRYARAAHDAGLKFAGYLTTFKVVGDGWNQAPYQFSLGYDSQSDQVIPTRFISIEDKRRRQDIVDMLKKMDRDPLIDYVGLDYVRTGPAGYEMVDQFVKDLNVPGPANYWSMTKEERIHWLARTVEEKENPEVVALFQWWRAHRVALALKDILDQAQMTKPVFTFTLGWEMGHQHGQDPAMFVDAGVNFNQIMLYEGDRNILDSMQKQWPDYLSRSNGMYAIGEMVDFDWVQKSLNPPAPEELYNREVETFRNWFPVNANVGMFWHDLYRILYGIKGPYSAMEWTIAGGKAFSTLQQAEGQSPLDLSMEVPKQAPAGVSVPIVVEIRNHSSQDMTGVMLHQIDTSKDYYTDLATVGPFDIPAGERVRVKSLYVSLPRESHPERDDRYMAAILVEKPGDSLRLFDFAYLKKFSGDAVMKGEGASPEAGADKKSEPQEQDP